MAEDKRAPHSLKEQTADQIRNEQRGGANTPIEPDADGGIEGNATMRKVWSEPGGEAYNYRQARTGQTSRAGFDGHDELTAAETPETTKHLSDATLSPDDRDATAEAIARASQGGSHSGGGPQDRAAHPHHRAGDPADVLGQGDDEVEHGAPDAPRSDPGAFPKRQPGGLASGLQPGGTSPGGGPGASVGSIGTGAGQTAGGASGSVKKSGV
jgi:hypothetical protein